MKFRLEVLILAASVWPALGQSGMTVVDVYLNGHDDSEVLLWPGRTLASGLFEKIGVHLKWHTGERPGGQTGFGIRTTACAPASVNPGALASARLLEGAGGDITIYADRILPLPTQFHILPDVVAGYVMAHELAHVMQGVARHSESGILKAQWSRENYTDMTLRKFAFTPRDVELIHLGLRDRAAGRRPERTSETESGRLERPHLEKQ
jgi:hypothetical protein